MDNEFSWEDFLNKALSNEIDSISEDEISQWASNLRREGFGKKHLSTLDHDDLKGIFEFTYLIENR
jgi:hypothetical protein